MRMRKSKGKFSGRQTGDGTQMQSFGKNQRSSYFQGRGRGISKGKQRRYYHPIRKDDVSTNKFLSGRGMPRGKGHFVYPDSYVECTESTNEDSHVTVYNQIVTQKNYKKLTPAQRSHLNNQLQILQQNVLKLFNIGEKYCLPNENHLIPLEEYKGWNIINLLSVLSRVKALGDGPREWINRKIDEQWSKKGIETPASWAYDKLLEDVGPPVLKDSLDYVKIFLAKQCFRDIMEIVQAYPRRFPGIFLLEIQALRDEATRLFPEKFDLSYEDFFSGVSSVVRQILLQVSYEKVKQSWISIGDTVKENPDEFPMYRRTVHMPWKKPAANKGS